VYAFFVIVFLVVFFVPKVQKQITPNYASDLLTCARDTQ